MPIDIGQLFNNIVIRRKSMKSKLQNRNGKDYLQIFPHGYDFPILLPVITKGSRKDIDSWTWNGSLDKPTLKPSIKSTHTNGKISHIWLTNGICKYLSDSTCGNKGKDLELKDLE